MTLSSRVLRLALLGAGFALCAVPAVWAAWPNNPVANVPLCTATSDQVSPAAVSDGAGGAIVVWHDYRNGNADIYARRVDAAGVPQWTANGVALCTTTGDQKLPLIVSDGAGGAVIVWEDQRSGNRDIYAQRVDAAGVAQWTANGVALCTAAGDQKDFAVVSDAEGGAIVAWADYRSGTNYDIYAQRMTAAGVAQWVADGRAVCTATGNQFTPTLAPGGAGGAIITWWDWRSGTDADIYAQRLLGSAAIWWAVDGVAICTATYTQEYPVIVADGTGGAIIAWEDSRSGSGYDLYAQRVNASGAAQWAANGVAFCSATGHEDNLAIVSDGGAGAILAWEDPRSGSDDIYAQRLTAAGAVQWGPNGLALCTATRDQGFHSMTSDGVGGAIVAWYDMRIDPLSSDAHAQRVNGAGAVQWTTDGVALSTAAGYQLAPTIVSDGAGGAIVAWDDMRSAYYHDIYAQRVDQWGCLGAQPTIASVRDVPDDEGGVVKVSWHASPLDSFPGYSITDYAVYRSVPPNLAPRALGEGDHSAAGAGAHRDPGRGTLLARQFGAATLFWEYLGTVTARRLPGYSTLAPMACDSVGGSAPRTLFMVEARTAGGAQWWFSDPDSGYSVDNLAPPAPAPFTGEYAAGAAALHWGMSPAADFATFRLYRGSSADFTPGPGNLVVAQPDTGYVDAAGQPYYYKLSAVDLHGNEGPYALLRPGDMADVPPGSLPRELALSPPAPNPLVRSTTLRLALPRAARVSLAVFDQQGRRVRTLIEGLLPAGEHPVVWDGRDGGGRPAASALYFVRLECEGRTLARRITAVR